MAKKKSKKNFLEQFSTNNKPDSFKEEELIPFIKKKIPINKNLIIIIASSLVVLIFLIWFLFFRPTIEMPSFIGQDISDINNWVKQQDIQTSGIVFKEEYSDEFDNKKIISQSIVDGKKIKKDAKITFTISKGADPDTLITVPDIISMNLIKINKWIDDNKLTGTKINYEFSDYDELDSVISYEFGNNVNESNFKRSSTLSITISKGKQSDQPINVPNLVGKNVAEATDWGSKNKIKIVKKEDYSNTVNKDSIISQSVNPGKKITSKESLTIVVSKGEAVYPPDFSSYSESNVIAWGTKNNVNIEIIRKYSSSVSVDKVIEQSIKDQPCNDGMSVTISLGNISRDKFSGSTLDDLKNWINEVNKMGANLTLGAQNYINDDVIPPNQIINISSVSVGSTITVNISKGRNILLKDGTSLTWSDACIEYNSSEEDVRKLCEENEGLSCKFYYIKDTSASAVIGKVKSISRKDTNSNPEVGSYISQNVDIIINVCESNS